MDSNKLYEYAARAQIVNPNVLRSMAETIHNDSSIIHQKPLAITKNGTYEDLSLYKSGKLNNAFVNSDKKSKYFISDEVQKQLATPDATIYFVPCKKFEGGTEEELIQYFKEIHLNIVIHHPFFTEGYQDIVWNADTCSSLKKYIEIQNSYAQFQDFTSDWGHIESIMLVPDVSIFPGAPFEGSGIIFFMPMSYKDKKFGYTITCDTYEKYNADGFYPLDVQVKPDVEPLVVSQNGIYNGKISRLTSTFIATNECKEDFVIVETGKGETTGLYALPFDIPKDLSVDTLKSFLQEYNMEITIAGVVLINKDTIDQYIAQGAIQDSGDCIIIDFVALCKNSMATDFGPVSGAPAVPGILFISSIGQPGIDPMYLNHIISFERQEEVQLDGYLPVTVNVPQGKPIPVATEAEMDTLSTEHKPENIGSYYTYTGETGKYTQNKDYKLSETGFTL